MNKEYATYGQLVKEKKLEPHQILSDTHTYGLCIEIDDVLFKVGNRAHVIKTDGEEFTERITDVFRSTARPYPACISFTNRNSEEVCIFEGEIKSIEKV